LILCSALALNPPPLTELDLSGNEIGEAGSGKKKETVREEKR
jgi:hypothetical protein